LIPRSRSILVAVLRSGLLRLAGTLVGIAVLLRTLDIGRAAHGLRDADPRLVLLGVGLAAYGVRSWLAKPQSVEPQRA